MVAAKPYLIARGISGHVTVQHKVGRNWAETACGYDTRPWSVAFMSERVAVIACRRAGCKQGEE